MMTNEIFIKRSVEKHGNKYDYSLVEINNIDYKVKIICPIHGIFIQKMYNHFNGGCKKCSTLKVSNEQKTTKEEFIKKSIEVHGNKYIYDLVNYINSKEKVIIICKEHGEFKQIPYSHLNGCGCSKCSNRYLHSNEDFIKSSVKLHGNKYDYSLVNYINNKEKVKILCRKCDQYFEQTPHSHLQNHGCPFCKPGTLGTKEEFIRKSKIKHGDRYDYSLVSYINYNTKVEIICSIHGSFFQEPGNHIQGQNCTYCKNSKGQDKIKNILSKKNIDFESEKKFDDCYNQRKLPFDFYLPDKNIIIEYDGEQHFRPIEIFGGKKTFEKLKINDKIKNNFCKKNNINLIRIPYYEYKNIENILNNIL